MASYNVDLPPSSLESLLTPSTAPTSSSSPSPSPSIVEPANLPMTPPIPPLTFIHPMVTHSNNDIQKPKLYAISKYPIPSDVEPTCFTNANKDAPWNSTMVDEFNALMAN
uniref:Uncharacterized protein n=1 Tax=Nelumbo nucifera TaxID=4432 RepID=A0A822Z6V0_NELNU|nr:TPA_asm: hypothetical protein HUJ06_013498 [Nelumbo nucifera]